MADLTRREWNKLVFSGLAIYRWPLLRRSGKEKKLNSRINGVLIGVQSYSFRDLPLDKAIEGMAEVGLSSCELWTGHVEPKELRLRYEESRSPEAREAIRKWRLSVPLEEFKTVRAKFDRAGIDLYAYNLSFRDDFTDAEIERGFEMAKALGVNVMTASSNVNTAKRIDPFAKRYKIRVGMHNHSNIRPNEFATPDDFAKALGGASEYIAINLDIGHFTAADFNAVEFLQRYHDRIVSLHIKDRKRHQGPNVPFGQGDTPIKEVLLLLRRNKWPIPANLEYEYEGGDTVEEVKRCFAYCKRVLGA